ncbi:hypothetical protein PFICI_00816 [Pestalotiopsis fici W106-1]|uniref:Uncharacterized protein n=1 Tax=Pestalotiopsis fici (strain W106-1 / CGMCC3.15140) TaxID=1229662 RepID=W3XLP9_PESFW|nr:uncharacterized protein PFICI_00816 [Pestalotiopsis fici W106-1]ETS86988.1 hypothetical protein PFICI_00816 [Pestalotiopsis fici W106-1]
MPPPPVLSGGDAALQAKPLNTKLRKLAIRTVIGCVSTLLISMAHSNFHNHTLGHSTRRFVQGALILRTQLQRDTSHRRIRAGNKVKDIIHTDRSTLGDFWMTCFEGISAAPR